MTGSACLMAAVGIAATFLPRELLTAWGATAEKQTVLLVQVLGALYIGFALLNWGARGVLIGGIYARPLAMGNFIHFAIAAITLTRESFSFESQALLIATGVYTVFATWFGLVVFMHPGGRRDES